MNGVDSAGYPEGLTSSCGMIGAMSTLELVADNVYLGVGTDVNWVVLTAGQDLTLIDSGYPGDYRRVVAGLASIGRSVDDVAAVLITHAHIDHIGSLPQLVANRSIPIYAAAAEVPHAHRDYLQQCSPIAVAANAWRPGVLGWSLRILRVGATSHVALPQAQNWPAQSDQSLDLPLDLPGAPVPIPLPGHTSGHSGYWLPEAGVVVTGDALVTAHATSRRLGPQMLLPMFDHDREANMASLATLAGVDAQALVPGHGPVYRGSIADAVQRALTRH